MLQNVNESEDYYNVGLSDIILTCSGTEKFLDPQKFIK